MTLPTRKPNRLAGYDYHTPNAYFITVCTKDKKCFLWNTAGFGIVKPENLSLSVYGIIVRQCITAIPEHYPAVSIDHFTIMPNHIHLLLQIHTDADGRPMVAPTVSRVVQQLKGAITKRIGYSVWQKLFHDYVLRGEKDYWKIWQYIENNPAKWEEDCFYMEESL